MKKILLVLLIIPLTLLSGWTSEKKQEEQMLSLCDKVDNILENYRDRSINSDEFISQISELENECITDDLLCTDITSFKFLRSDSKQEFFDAYANSLNRDCQLIREKQKK